ncbi:hypothetical protein DER44DRAFT_806839 [Fusarium oxysporum]|nr:hypothetical protein DER44DRAFT_806839 [Fusarium oxysporum]
MTSAPVHSEIKTPTPSVSISPNDCQVHRQSETPHLDRLLQNRPKAELQPAVTIVTGFLQELYTAKKTGKISKEDKKALKSEVKGLVKGIKGDVKARKKEIKGQ